MKENETETALSTFKEYLLTETSKKYPYFTYVLWTGKGKTNLYYESLKHLIHSKRLKEDKTNVFFISTARFFKEKKQKKAETETNFCLDYYGKEHNVTVHYIPYSKLYFKGIRRSGFNNIVICDEVHYLKNLRSKRTQAVKRFIDTFDYKLNSFFFICGSATPIKNTLSDLWSILSFTVYKRALQQSIHPPSIFRDNFLREYSAKKTLNPYSHNYDYTGVNMEKFAKLKKSLVGFYFGKIGLTLEYKLNIQTTFHKVDKDIENEYYQNLKETNRIDSDDNLVLFLKQNSNVHKTISRLSICIFNQEVIPRIVKGGLGKVCVLSRYKNTNEQVHSAYKLINHTVRSTDDHQDVQPNEDVIYFTTFGKVLDSIDLNYFNTVFLLELPYSYADYTQLKGRFIRRNNVHDVNLNIELPKDSVVKRVLKLLEEKKDITEAMYE